MSKIPLTLNPLFEGPWQCLRKVWENKNHVTGTSPVFQSQTMCILDITSLHLICPQGFFFFCALYSNFLICMTVSWQGVPQHNYLTNAWRSTTFCLFWTFYQFSTQRFITSFTGITIHHAHWKYEWFISEMCVETF